MDPGSSYWLSNISFDHEVWENVPLNVSGCLEAGANYGMLWIKHKCSCCDHASFHDYFFTNKEGDKALHMMGVCKHLNGSIHVHLPDDVLGNFKLIDGHNLIDDAYVLRFAANVCYSDRLNWSVNELFTNIRSTIQMRAHLVVPQRAGGLLLPAGA